MPRETLHAPLTPDSSISAVFCLKAVRWPPCLLSLTFLFFPYTRIGATAHMGPANCQHACWLHPQQHDSAEKSSLRKRRTYERRADTGSMLKWYPKDAQWGESAPQLKPKGGPADLTHLYYTRPPPPPPQNTTSMHATTAVLLTTEESEAASILAHLHLRERAGLRTVSRKVLTRPQFSENPGTEDSTPATDHSSESPC